MRPGPPPKPTAIKKLQGNPGKRPLPKNEPQPDPLEKIPKPPSYLSKGAKKIWKEEAPKLAKLGVLTEIDLKTFSIVCSVLFRYEEAERQMNRLAKKEDPLNGAISVNSRGNMDCSALLDLSHKSMNMALKYLAEFGMTPSSRSRIEIKKAPKKNPKKKGVLTVING